MSNILFHKVTQLPEVVESNAFYFVENGDFADSYVTTSGPEPQAKQIGRSSSQINAMIDAKLDEHNSLKIVADITERDILAADLNRNIVVLVTDATDDETVDVGAALYAYDSELDLFTKIAEYESMDVVLEWASIEGKPESSVEDIDDAVARKHSHTNAETLDAIEDAGSGLIITDEERTKLENIQEGATKTVWNSSEW